jgi:hypothetical protein
MDDRAGAGEEGMIRVQLELHLRRQPISGALRSEGGSEQRFVGWLGFIDALTRLQEQGDTGANPGGPEARPGMGRHQAVHQRQGVTMTEHTPTTQPTLVLGGIGKTGRRIADRLAARGVPVRIRSRSAPSPFGARSRPGEH